MAKHGYDYRHDFEECRDCGLVSHETEEAVSSPLNQKASRSRRAWFDPQTERAFDIEPRCTTVRKLGAAARSAAN